jgi:hypothetical protein
MQQITIRGIEPEIEEKIRRIARQNRQSINQVLKDIIRKEFGGGQCLPRAATLKQLAGGWSRDEAAEFERAIESCEQIDEAMWR